MKVADGDVEEVEVEVVFDEVVVAVVLKLAGAVVVVEGGGARL